MNDNGLPTENLPDILEIEGVNAKGYGIMPKLVMQDSRLTIEAKAIYAYIVSFAGAGSSAFPSLKKILSELNISENRFYKHRKLLINHNFLTVKQVKNAKGMIIKNVYTLVSNPQQSKEIDQVNSLSEQQHGGTLQNEGGGIPQNEGGGTLQNEGHIINNTKINSLKLTNTNIDTKTDTEKQKKQQLELLTQFAKTQRDQLFLSEDILELIGLFSATTKEAENTIGLILRAKKKAQNDYNTILLVDSSDAWQEDIEQTLRRLYHKIKTDDKIKQIESYMFKALYTTFENMVLEKNALNTSVNSDNLKVPIHNYLQNE